MAFLDFFRSKPQPQQRSFQAARLDRFTASWLAATDSINRELRGDLDRLRARARQTGKDNEYGRKYIAMCGANIVGPNGFNLQARAARDNGEPDEADNAAIEAAFYDWARKGVCEVSGRVSFNDLCRTVIAGMPTDGEFLIRMVRGAAAGNKYGFALQLIDVDRLDTAYNQHAGTGRNAVIMGVEVDAVRRPVAYHILTSHPAENGQRSRERVPSDDIIHGFVQDHTEQVRGIPWMTPSLLSLHHLGEFEKSALLAARKGADTLGFFVSPEGVPPVNDGGEGEDPITVSVPGSYDTLPDGYDFRPYDSKYPDAMLAAFSKHYLRRVASGFNVAYNGLANDLEGVNFSSIRSGVIEERDNWMTRQAWFTDALLDVVYDEWIKAALLRSAITLPSGSPLPASRLEKFRAHQWQGRRWQWVDPYKDIMASVEAINNNLADPYTIAAQTGQDLEDVLAAVARANKFAEKLGLEKFGSTKGKPPVNQQDQNQGE
jgi:lambda family phage portal protein